MMTDANSLDGRKLSLSAQKALRQRVIEAYKKGIKRTQIAKTFGMSRQWVWKVLRAFEKHGEEAAIAGHSRGPKPETSDKMRRLSRQEEAKLMAWIIDSNPSQLKFPWAVWTRKAVRDLIRREFGKEIVIRTVSAYMKRWNMTPQRPKKKALQQDPVPELPRCCDSQEFGRHFFELRP
jgi:transposase